MVNVKMKKTISVLLLILWIAFIWCHSMMPAPVSEGQSGRILEILRRFPMFRSWLTDYIVRKAAHFTEYAVEGVLVGWCSRQFHDKTYDHVSRILLTGFLTAFFDETIQLFVEGRSGKVSDIWIDICGFMCGLFVFTGLNLLYARLRAGKTEKPLKTLKK